MGIISLLAGMVLFCLGALYLWNKLEKRAANDWKLIAEGRYESSIVRTTITPTTGFAVMVPVMKIIMSDGNSIAVADIHKLPSPGTHIKIYKNKLGQYKIETA